MRAFDGALELVLPLRGETVDRLRAGPAQRLAGEPSALEAGAHERVDRLEPLPVGHQPAAFLAAHVAVGADGRGQPGGADRGVLLQLDVGARLVEGGVGQRGDADVDVLFHRFDGEVAATVTRRRGAVRVVVIH